MWGLRRLVLGRVLEVMVLFGACLELRSTKNIVCSSLELHQLVQLNKSHQMFSDLWSIPETTFTHGFANFQSHIT